MAHLLVNTNHLKKGMTICNGVYSKGLVIVPENTPVTKEVIDLLTKHFIDSVLVEYNPVETTASANNEITRDSVQYKQFEQNFHIAEETLSDNLMELVSTNKEVNVSSLLDMMNKVLEDSGGEINLCSMLLMMKNDAENLYAHSINVALIGQILARWMNFNQKNIERVILASLMHDIGILKINSDPNPDVFHEELAGNKKYYKHSTLGYELLKDKIIDNSIIKTVLTHHERLDGSGFPLGVTGGQINPIARVVAIADTYDTMTMKRNDGSLTSPLDILELLNKTGRHKLDANMIMVFVTHFVDKFIRKNVLLSNGEEANIIMINQTNLSRPMVQAGNRFIDLNKTKDISIVKILT